MPLVLLVLLVPEQIQHRKPPSALRLTPLQILHPTKPQGHAPAKENQAPIEVRLTEETSSARTRSPAAPKNVLPRKQPKVAIIIDDMGYNLEIGQQLVRLPLPLSFSFLPAAPYTSELSELANASGRTVLVHVPMEPKDQTNKQEPLTLKVTDTGQQVREKIDQMLVAVPMATGANNHMGSRFTENRQGMRQVLGRLKERALFFIDSSTSATSIAETTARQMDIPTTRRRVFLDNVPKEEAVCSQLGLLTEIAVREGQAIAIGHPNQATLAALSRCAAQRLVGVEFVGAEELTH